MSTIHECRRHIKEEEHQQRDNRHTSAADEHSSSYPPAAEDGDDYEEDGGLSLLPPLNIAIVSPLTPLSGNLTTARRIASLLLESSSWPAALPGGEEDEGSVMTTRKRRSGRRRIGHVRIFDTDAGAHTSGCGRGPMGVVSAAGTSDASALPQRAGAASARGRPHQCDESPAEQEQHPSLSSCSSSFAGPHFDVCFIIHALRGCRAFRKLFRVVKGDGVGVSDEGCSEEVPPSPSPPFPPFTVTAGNVVVVFGGTDVNESTRDEKALAEMTRLMRGDGADADEGVSSSVNAFVCFSEELRDAAMGFWGSPPLSPASASHRAGADASSLLSSSFSPSPSPVLMTLSNSFVIPQSVDFSDCYHRGGGGVEEEEVPTLLRAQSADGSPTNPLTAIAEQLLLSLPLRSTDGEGISGGAPSFPPLSYPSSSCVSVSTCISSSSFILMGAVRKVKGQSFALDAWDALRGQMAVAVSGGRCSSPSAPTDSASARRHHDVFLWLIGPCLDDAYLLGSGGASNDGGILRRVDAIVELGEEGATDASAPAAALEGFPPLRVKRCEWVRRDEEVTTANDYRSDGDVGALVRFHTVWVRGGVPRWLVPSTLQQEGAPPPSPRHLDHTTINAPRNIPPPPPPPRLHRHHRIVALLNTSASEGQPQTVLECMALQQRRPSVGSSRGGGGEGEGYPCAATGSGTRMGVPVVVRNVPGNRSVVFDRCAPSSSASSSPPSSSDGTLSDKNDNGFLVSTPRELASVMRRLLLLESSSSGEEGAGDVAAAEAVAADVRRRIANGVAYTRAHHSRAAEGQGYASVLDWCLSSSSH